VRLKLSPTRNSLEDYSSISKSYELMTHFICIFVPIAAVAPFLPMGYINPSPFLPWCSIVQYPFWCDVNSREDCFLRGYEYRKFFFTYGGIIYLLLYMVGILTLIILTGFIVISFYQSQRQARTPVVAQQQNHFVKILLPCKKSQSSSSSAAFFMNVNASTSNEENDQKRLASASDENHESTRHIATSHHHEQESEISPSTTPMHYQPFKRIVVQSCAYLVVLLITNCAGLILRTFLSGNNHTMQLLHILFLSLQGFFTFIVFLSDKAYRQYQRFAPPKSSPSIAGGLGNESFPTKKRRPQEDENVEVYFMNGPMSALDLEPSQTIRKLHNKKEEEEGLEEGYNTSTTTGVRPCDLSFPVPSVELQCFNNNVISHSNFPLLLGMISVEESDSNSSSDSSSISFPSSITSDPSCTLSDASILEDIDTSPTFTKKIAFNSSFYQNVRENLKKQYHNNYTLTPAGKRDRSDCGDTMKSSDDHDQQQNREPCRIPSSLDLSTIAEERSLQSLQSCPDFVV
jgi:hypothetical protein